nr:MAG TPA: hypothetical protein [Caudoviricetes sp.]
MRSNRPFIPYLIRPIRYSYHLTVFKSRILQDLAHFRNFFGKLPKTGVCQPIPEPAPAVLI